METIKSWADETGVEISDLQAQKLHAYCARVLSANKTMNLTGANDMPELINRHIIDSLSVLKHFSFAEGSAVVDVGTGAGFPGIPLAICTKSDFTLLDSLNKRLVFLDSLINELNIKNCRVDCARAEDYGKPQSSREFFDIAVSRAVAPLNLLLEYALPLVKLGGVFYSYKSAACSQEIAKAENAIRVLGGALNSLKTYKLLGGEEFCILEISKILPTPDKYPRRTGIPAKRPID